MSNWFKKNWWKIFWPSALGIEISQWTLRVGLEALLPRPELPGLPLDRGDDRSPTFAWDGMHTSQGPGLTIPVIGGRHAFPGQVIWSDVFASISGGSPVELLRVVLFLSEGPIYRIGDQLARVADGLGGFAGSLGSAPVPSGIRINGNLLDSTTNDPGARVWIRPGTFDQPALPTNPFRGATAALSVGEPLEDQGSEAIFSVTSTEAISTIGFVFAAPGGIYQQDQSGNQSAYPVTVAIAWRSEGLSAWRSFYSVGGITPFPGQALASTPTLAAFVETFSAALQPMGASVNGPIEVRVTRSTPIGSRSSVISSLNWRNISISIEQEFSYPGCALLGIEIPSGSRFSGNIPNFQVVCDGVLLRTWDETLGFSAPCWDPPAAPHDYSTSPPGRNPAWLLLEYLTNKRWGLGNRLKLERINLPSIRRWAAFCQSEPNPLDPWGEPGFLCDIAIDYSRSSWDWVLAICATGRAAPTWVNGQLTIVYRYRDAHSDPGPHGIIVAAKVPVQLITAGNCNRVQVQWLSTLARPTALQFQFLNEAKFYAHDVFVAEDQEAPALQDPTDPDADAWRPEVVQAFGVTRQSQLKRDAVFAHRTNRLVRRTLSFTCGPWMLSAQVGDLIEFQHDLLRPFGSDVPLAMQVLVGGDSVAEITVDHVVTGPGLAFAGRSATGASVHRNVTSVVATTIRGRPATRLLFTSGVVTIAAGATVAVGLQDKLVETYEILGINLQDDVHREVSAVQWVPEVYDPIAPDFDDEAPEPLTLTQPDDESAEPIAEDLRVIPMERGHRVLWHRPQGRGTARARVYARIPNVAEQWFLVDETVRADVDVPWFSTWRTYEVAVALENAAGHYGPPDTAARFEFTADEFPAWGPVAPTNVTATQSVGENLLVLRWDATDGRELDYYEVRCGDDWAAGAVVYRGRQAEARLRPPPGHLTYQVAPRTRSGLYGPRTMVTVTLTAVPYPGASVIDTAAYWPAGAGVGTHSGTVVDSATEPAAPFLRLVDGVSSGTFTSDEVSLGYEAPFFLRVAVSPQELDGLTVDEWTFACESGEARWRTVDTRPASAGLPGIDWSSLVDDLVMTIDDLPGDLRAAGTLGEVGSHVLARVESRTFTGGAWGAWAEHVDRTAVCSKWQARIQLARASTQRSVRIRTFRLETLI